MNDSAKRMRRPKADTTEISDLLDEARAGKYELPDFQRGLEWREEDRIKLFDSIYRGFPIGDILFWEPEEPRQGSNKYGPFEPRVRINDPWLIVDGQQRLSTLFGCLLLRERRGTEPSDEDWRLAFDVDKRRIVRLPIDAGRQLLPLPIAIDTARYLKWTRALPDEHRDERMQAGDDFSKALRTYRIPYYVVRTSDRGLLQQVFERVNTTGKSLSGTDVFNALFPTRLNVVAKDLESTGFGRIDPEWLLQAVKVMAGMDPAGQFAKQLNSMDEAQTSTDRAEPSLFDADDGDVDSEPSSTRELLTAIQPRLMKAALSTIALVQEAGIRRIEILPYALVLPVLMHFFDKFPTVSESVQRNLTLFLWHVSAGGGLQRHRATFLRGVARIIRDAASAKDAVEGLVAYSAGSPSGEDLQSQHDWRSGATRLVALALFELEPREIETGEGIPVWDLLPEKGHELFQRIWSYGVDAFAATSSNRIISATFGGPSAGRQLEDMAIHSAGVQGGLFGAEFEGIPPVVLASQAISEEAWAALMARDRLKFLRLRAARIAELVDSFLARKLGVLG